MQWDVLDRAFGGHATLVLIGDPKQAIYAFRGGDIVTYLTAAETAGDNRPWHQLAQRRRPVDALQALFARRRARRPADRRARRRRRTMAAPGWSAHRRRTAPVAAGAARDVRPPRTERPDRRLRSHIATDLAADIGALLRSDATFDGGRRGRRHRGDRREASATPARATTRWPRPGVPAVYTGDSDVFASRRPTTGCRCWRRSTSRIGPGRCGRRR